MIIVYDTKERVAVQLSGISEDVLVKLEQNQLKLDSTYISLSSFGTAKIVNKSNVMVEESPGLCRCRL